MICSQGALAKERRGEFFFKKNERGGWKTKEGESFFLNKGEGNGKEAKEERGQGAKQR